MFKRILIPLDGSELAERALAPALVVAKQYKAELLLLTAPMIAPALTAVVHSYDIPAFDASMKQMHAEAEQYLTYKRDTLRYEGLVIRKQVTEGDPATVIVDTAAEQHADLIVMSTHGYTGMERWVMGSTAERVLQSAPCPVLILRSRQPIFKMAITLDGSELAEQALAPGLAVAEAFSAAVTLLRVKEPYAKPDLNLVRQLEHVEPGLGQHMMDDFYGHVDNYLERVRIESQANYPQLEVLSLQGPVAPTLADYIENNEIDLVVMATHGRTGLGRWVYGSVTQKLLRNMRCAMLVVRPS